MTYQVADRVATCGDMVDCAAYGRTQDPTILLRLCLRWVEPTPTEADLRALPLGDWVKLVLDVLTALNGQVNEFRSATATAEAVARLPTAH